MDDWPIATSEHIPKDTAYIAIPSEDDEEPKWIKLLKFEGVELSEKEKDELSEMVMVNRDFDFEMEPILKDNKEE